MRGVGCELLLGHAGKLKQSKHDLAAVAIWHDPQRVIDLQTRFQGHPVVYDAEAVARREAHAGGAKNASRYSVVSILRQSRCKA